MTGEAEICNAAREENNRSEELFVQDAFFERMAIAPARVLGETAGPLTVGSSDLVVFDPGEEWTFDRPRSKSANSPWLGRALTGKVTHVFTRSGLVSPTGEGDS